MEEKNKILLKRLLIAVLIIVIMEEIAKFDTKTSSFFNHYDPEMVKWFDETVKSRRENQDHNKDKKNW